MLRRNRPTKPPTQFEPEMATVPGTSISYLAAGQGDPVVLLHGLAGSKELWWGTVRALSNKHRALAPDWPRNGGSGVVADREMLDRFADATIEACTALGLEQVALVGHSLGGNVAARVALARRDLVSRLILVDPAIDAKYLAPFTRLYSHPRLGERVLRLNRVVLAPLVWYGGRVPNEPGGGFIRPLARRTSYAARLDAAEMFASVQALKNGSLGDRVAAITQPTLVLAGARDPVVHPNQARELAKTIPNAELCLMPGAYHNPMDEQPGRFIRILLDYLSRHPIVQ